MLKVLLYNGGMKLAGKSGVGRAMEHQARALQNAGIPYTHDPGEDYNIVQLNTVFPDSLWMGLKARMQGKKVVYYGHFHHGGFQEFFYGIQSGGGAV